MAYFPSSGQYGILVKDEKSRKPLSSVNCWSSNGMNQLSDEKGSLNLTSIPDTLFFSHVGYYTNFISKNQILKETNVYLSPRVYTLEEAVVIPTKTAYEIIRKISENQGENYDVDFTRDYLINHRTEKDENEELGLNGVLRISRKGKYENFSISKPIGITRSYYENKQEHENNVFIRANRVFSGYFIKNYNFFSKSKFYNYNIDNNSINSIVISFEPKGNQKFGYKGILEVSKSDYGIIRFSAELIFNPKNFRTAVFAGPKKSDKYLFLKEEFSYEFEKENDTYVLKEASYLNETKQLNTRLCTGNTSCTFITRTFLSNMVDSKEPFTSSDIRNLEFVD